MPDSKKSCALCIFCLKVSDGTGFNREHIIPQNVGGNLFLDNLVCESCNSILGTEVDCEILKMPEILLAMNKLGIPYDREGVLRSYYDSELVSGEERMRAMPSADGFQLLTQDLEDGSRITPGHALAVDVLSKTLMRDVGLRDAGLSPARIDDILSDLESRYDDAGQDQEVECPELGLIVVRRSVELRAEATPKSSAKMERLVGKIAIEWLFGCFGKTFVAMAPWSVDLRNLVCGDDPPATLHIFRSAPVNPEIRRVHSIYVYLHGSFSKVSVAFFGGIEFTMIAPPMPLSVLNEFSAATDMPDAIGIAYEQDLAEGEKRFFGLCADGSSKYLGVL